MQYKTLDTDKFIDNILPHGSGIDCDWEAEVYKSGKVKFSNSFHSMDNSGGYDGFMPFSFTVGVIETATIIGYSYVVSNVRCCESRLISFDGLQNYLNELIWQVIVDHADVIGKYIIWKG